MMERKKWGVKEEITRDEGVKEGGFCHYVGRSWLLEAEGNC
jgi:hypothetical protein